ncbi:protein SODIUM POTASSIUM ROOT DEFECTIVE 2-like [Ananas comosus]|uniref:Protein SODIUM POTASSIUM ROOT DEFECTIVE 2-like n=1 Tax=Ananas comosus TaxID=4615 RepID=A0A6P5GS25_ANACO|nr:protein SODIUM POTASSIUM ROOT DEFECTIVE 2-like [Ananas comosus]
MASLLFKDMKRKSFSCASPAAAAICTSIDRKSIFLPTTRSTPHHQRDLQKQKSYYPSSNNKPKSQNLSCSKNQSEKLIDLISPVDSSRHLLSSSRYLSDDSAFIDIFPHDSTPVSTLIPIDSSKFRAKREDDKVILRSSSTRSQDQVVALRVSIHCKGCAGKVRKHISKMEGVTSFDIDLATKKVTVAGEVTPLGVLNSVSKVKHAQFWQSPPRASASF